MADSILKADGRRTVAVVGMAHMYVNMMCVCVCVCLCTFVDQVPSCHGSINMCPHMHAPADRPEDVHMHITVSP